MIRNFILLTITFSFAVAASSQTPGQASDEQKEKMKRLQADRERLDHNLRSHVKRTIYLRDYCDSLWKKVDSVKANARDSLQAARKSKPYQDKLDYYLTLLDDQVTRQNKCSDSLQLVLNKIDSLRKAVQK
jgi:hypothetical protein